MFPYETDGLIFTPSNKSVGSDEINKLTAPRKTTWGYSLKWKPSYFNTDFLVLTLKDESGKEIIAIIIKKE